MEYASGKILARALTTTVFVGIFECFQKSANYMEISLTIAVTILDSKSE